MFSDIKVREFEATYLIRYLVSVSFIIVNLSIDGITELSHLKSDISKLWFVSALAVQQNTLCCFVIQSLMAVSILSSFFTSC